jgi:lysyl-tRNA synthetase class 2
MAISNIKKARLKKLEVVKKAGINPYPIKTKRTHSIEEALIRFEELSRAKNRVVLAGRIRSLREHGGSAFLHFEDGSGRIQAYFKRDLLGERKYRFFLDNFDIGDFIEIAGVLFITKKGEKTIEVSDFRMLAKSLLPLPEKWHGLKDVEERFRKRYLDLIMNPEVRDKFKMRSRIVEELRNLLEAQSFIEVETPILQPIPGGAAARPFKTHLNALRLDLFLRVSPELYLKRLLVGGFEKVYEIGKCFRNEGIDAYHNPDFTMLELYWAYQERDGLMNFTENLLTKLVKKIKGTEIFSYQGKEINFKTPWKRVSFASLMKMHCQIDIEKASRDGLGKKLRELGVKTQKNNQKCLLLDELYKKVCRPKLINPTFVVDHPIEMAVLAKAREDNPKYAHRFQLVVGGIELINGFSELNDPIDQRKRFKESKIALERRDEDFLESLEYGMPPAAGFGMGIDRLVVLLTDSHSLREVILFPTMRPK